MEHYINETLKIKEQHLMMSKIIQQLDLRRPIYRASTHYGHFGKKDLPWEQTNHLARFIKALHLQS